MPLNSYSQNSNPYTSGGYEKTKLKKLVLIVVGIILAIIIVMALAPESQQSKYTKSATAAARKKTPHAKVIDVKVADGFTLATVSDPTAAGQAKAGNLTYFKVNKDGSMTQLASGSYFSTVDLLGFGVPLSAQAKLVGRNLTQVKQALAGECGYISGDAPSYVGFNGSFNPGGWQIDAGTLDGLEQALTNTLSDKNAQEKYNEKVICIHTTAQKSNLVIDKQTYVSTFTLGLQFITGNGLVTDHTFTFAIGFNHYRSYTLDGQKID